jgi:drug/metabolite transporter (DMT)-like permease
MLALVVSVVFMAGFGLVVRASQRRGLHMLGVGLCNYLAAALFYGLWILRDGLWTCDWRTAAIGAIGGAFYGGGFFLILAPMRWRGVGIVSAILGLSVLLPVLFSFILWREVLAPVQVAGVALALCALPLLGFDEGARGGKLTPGMAAVMLGLFLVNGGCMTVQKWFHTTGLDGERPVFFWYLFTVAAAILLVAWLTRSRELERTDLGYGVLLGACNVLANLALLAALDRLPGVVVFPVMQAGVMIFSVLFGQVAWRERPGRLGLAGIGLAAGAVALINL